ncbi:hypothetical protein [Phycicoccus duodecadis]|uniref:Lipoprotein n=1 Tax=Phycicoccus duodecadis TaxID=173053 RepID=A0A2N3YH94_9MICO|nr:hypothetical protein [Phycicoccus duodecadis]PKW26219.1 hypothetical protein ATL31_1025 [Phycicoccus duodecadis]
MRPARGRRGRAGRVGTALAALVALLLSGCSMWAPVQTSRPYVPADGLALSTPSVEFENLVVVVDDVHQVGVLVGQAVSSVTHPVDVTVSVDGGEVSEPVTIPPDTGDGITSRRIPLRLGPVPAPPGALVHLEVVIEPGGRHVVDVPVLPPGSGLGYYGGITS